MNTVSFTTPSANFLQGMDKTHGPSGKLSAKSDEKGEAFSSLMSNIDSQIPNEPPVLEEGKEGIGQDVKAPPQDVLLNSPETITPATAQEKKQQAESTYLQVQGGGVDPLTRRVVLQNFLKKMKEQLGVEPEALVQAFAKMDPSDLMMPPEQTVDKVIEQLDLSEDEIPVARKLFEDMLQQTASTSMAEYLKSSGQQISVELISRQELQQKALRRSLDELSDKFFVDGRKLAMQQKELKTATQNNSGFKQAALQAYSENMASDSEKQPSMVAAPLMAKASSSASTSASSMQAPSLPMNFTAASSGSFELPPEMAAETKTAEAFGKPVAISQDISHNAVTASEIQSAEGMEAAVTPDSSWPQAISEIPEGDFLTSEMSQSSPAMEINEDGFVIPKAQTSMEAASQQPMAVVTEPNTEGHSWGDKEGDPQAEQGIHMAQPATTHKTSSDVHSTFVVSQPQMTEADEAANVREIMNQAQFMIRRGGGEMRIQLHPEGLGEVNLKVMVQDGQVNVEMLTDSHDAKKLLEKGLSDLKATLASHQLNVEGIKVNLGGQIQNELHQQHEQAERQMAQQFLSEFKHQNDNWRREFFDIGVARRPRSQIEPADGVYSNRPPRKKASSSGRLDLVA